MTQRRSDDIWGYRNSNIIYKYKTFVKKIYSTFGATGTTISYINIDIIYILLIPKILAVVSLVNTIFVANGKFAKNGY